MISTQISHEDVAKFAVDRVNLPPADAQRHRDQVNGLRKRLEAKIDADPDYGLVKMLHAGSVAKGTALRTVNDLDVAVYVMASAAPEKDPDLVAWLADRLADANPSMDHDQFEENDHCVTVNFRGSGLNVDVVPVLYEGEPDDRGYLVRKRTGDRVLTSIPLHLDFIRSRKKDYGPDFAQLIRLSKWWKRTVVNSDADFRFKSFMIELLWAHLADAGLALADYPTALERFFTYIVRTELTEQVAFTDYNTATEIPARGAAAIEVLDPVNPDNNVAVRYDDADRVRIVDAAQDALSALGEARFATTKGRAVDCWQSVLGASFGG
jgi:tRNA nucleotidyltransferase (CCA-adding enzyme)